MMMMISGRFSPSARCNAEARLAKWTAHQKTQVGVEPTSTALQAVASPSGSRVICQYPRQESNLDLDLRRVVSCPLHHKDVSTGVRDQESGVRSQYLTPDP